MATYRCEHCKGVFEKNKGSTTKANEEAKRIFGVDNASEDPSMAQICDDCWQKFKKWYDSMGRGD